MSNSVRIRSVQPSTCLVGAYCAHAILTVKLVFIVLRCSARGDMFTPRKIVVDLRCGSR